MSMRGSTPPTQRLPHTQRVQARGCATEHCSAVLHRKHIAEDDLTTDERAGREGARDGAIVAGVSALEALSTAGEPQPHQPPRAP